MAPVDDVASAFKNAASEPANEVKNRGALCLGRAFNFGNSAGEPDACAGEGGSLQRRVRMLRGHGEIGSLFLGLPTSLLGCDLNPLPDFQMVGAWIIGVIREQSRQ